MLVAYLITAAATLASALANAAHPLQVRQETTIVPPECSSSSQSWMSCMSTVNSQDTICDEGDDISPCVCNFYASQSICWTKYCTTAGPALDLLQSQVSIACTTDGVPGVAATAAATTTPATGQTAVASESISTPTQSASPGTQTTSTAASATASSKTGSQNAAPADRLPGYGLGIALVAIAGGLGLVACL